MDLVSSSGARAGIRVRSDLSRTSFSMRITCDYLVLGSGIAGLTFALEAQKHGTVIVVTKRLARDAATTWAQGGIAAVLDPSDSFEAHVSDTLGTGGGLSREDIVDMVVRDGPARIAELIDLGAKFSARESNEHQLDLTREGGHSARRVVHAGDITGAEVERALLAAVAESVNIKVLEHHMAVDLIELSKFGGPNAVAGAYVLDTQSGTVHTVAARATVLATGGAGKVYLYTTNPDVATGDGVAMAYRAGAAIANMEFFQFHPTCLYNDKAKSFLISEALRGEGGVLRLSDGTAFMADHHEMKDLAPRDVVARAIDFELKKSGADCVYLDMSSRPSSYLVERFPNIHAACVSFGIDMTREPIPVVPAAHYMCGGVVVDRDGRTTLRGLYAVGEVSCTGLHGANRLASNSLLEGLVYGHRAAVALGTKRYDGVLAEVPDWEVGDAAESDEAVVVSQNWDELRRFMWNYVGIVRSDKRLQRASRRIALLKEEIREYYWTHLVTSDLLELRNIADIAEMIVACATARKESRGLHFNVDHPARLADFAADTILVRGGFAAVRTQKRGPVS